jgi:hypothetical protein
VWVSVVIDVFAIMWVVFRVEVEGFGVVSGFGIGASHVTGVLVMSLRRVGLVGFLYR